MFFFYITVSILTCPSPCGFIISMHVNAIFSSLRLQSIRILYCSMFAHIIKVRAIKRIISCSCHVQCFI